MIGQTVKVKGKVMSVNVTQSIVTLFIFLDIR